MAKRGAQCPQRAATPKPPWQSSVTIQQPENAKAEAEDSTGGGRETGTVWKWTLDDFPLMNAWTSSTGNAVR